MQGVKGHKIQVTSRFQGKAESGDIQLLEFVRLQICDGFQNQHSRLLDAMKVVG